jgi:hypothetical protein
MERKKRELFALVAEGSIGSIIGLTEYILLMSRFNSGGSVSHVTLIGQRGEPQSHISL